jgi:hypothetical protein
VERERPDLVCLFVGHTRIHAPDAAPKKIVQEPNFSANDVSDMVD